MKKFLIAIVLFVVGLSVSAQECFDVQLTPTAGQCKSDAKLRVTAQPKSPMPAGCTSSGNYSVELTKPSGAQVCKPFRALHIPMCLPIYN